MLIKHADRHLVVGLIKQCSILHDIACKIILEDVDYELEFSGDKLEALLYHHSF